MSDDGHGPDFGCTYYKCEVDVESCPFVKQGSSSSIEVVPVPFGCRHEWRQLQPAEVHNVRFFCIFCLAQNDAPDMS